MPHLARLLAQNRDWARTMQEGTPDYFSRLATQQAPEWLWIGCSDSRVPANQIVGLEPGEMFVHRNVANLVVHSDFNCLSVLQYAVEILRVKYIIVCGHYGCGGVKAAMEPENHGLVDNWLRPIREIAWLHQEELVSIPDGPSRRDRLCELNVLAQAIHVSDTTVVQEAWRQGRPLSVHAWIYSLRDGLIKDLGYRVSSPEAVENFRRR